MLSNKLQFAITSYWMSQWNY